MTAKCRDTIVPHLLANADGSPLRIVIGAADGDTERVAKAILAKLNDLDGLKLSWDEFPEGAKAAALDIARAAIEAMPVSLVSSAPLDHRP